MLFDFSHDTTPHNLMTATNVSPMRRANRPG
jgi:hypothetical protein